MTPYIHKVQYYETDKMGITHHSNYIRWMEEARVDYLDKIGSPYAKLEEEGLVSPVVSLSCHYMRTTTFDDVVQIRVSLREYRGVRFTFAYEMYLQDRPEPVFTGTSTHCFLDPAGRPVALRKKHPALDALLRANVEENEA